MRTHLFEFEDCTWMPVVIRDGGLDYLRFLLEATRFYDPIVPILDEAIERTGATRIVDLCSGGGGAIAQVLDGLDRPGVAVTLTDRFPNVPTFRWLASRSGGRISCRESSVNAADVPPDLEGLRTMFSAVHHFDTDALQGVLRDAVQRRQGIAIFDASEKGIRPWLGVPVICLLHPVLFTLCTPFFRPFRVSRLVFTYILPLIPLYTIWDGCVSGFRLYAQEELLAIARGIGEADYEWRAGRVRNRLGAHVLWLTGLPRRADAPATSAGSRL